MDLRLTDPALDPAAFVKGKAERWRSIFDSRNLSLALLSLSVANLCFLPVWVPILNLAKDPSLRFFQHEPPHFSLLWALLADIACLAALFFISALLRRSRSLPRKGFGTAVLIVCVCLALYQLNYWFSEPLYRILPSRGILPFKLTLLGALLFGLIRFPSRTKLILKRFFLILAPILPVFILQGFWSYATVDLRRTGAGQASAPWLPVAQGSPRAVWIVFDELDERLLFDVRPKAIQMPEFDRLRAETLFADHAAPPGPETLWSMPSFLLGRKIYNPQGDTSRLSVQFSPGSSWQEFTKEPNVFRQAGAMGFNTGLTGWYLPYCRLIGQDLNACSWVNVGPSLASTENSLRLKPFLRDASFLVRSVRMTFPNLLAPYVKAAVPDDALARRYQIINAVKVVTENAIQMLRDPRLNFVLIHVPAPHPPGIWDIHKQEFTFSHTDYLNNYELADRIMGQIRGTLESTGDWNRTAILVTSDHPYRTSWWTYEPIWNKELLEITRARQQYPYVPFLLKLPLQQSPLAYRREFSNVLSGRLLLDILQGHLHTAQEAAVWIDQH